MILRQEHLNTTHTVEGTWVQHNWDYAESAVFRLGVTGLYHIIIG